MFDNQAIAGSWPELYRRVTAPETVERWAQTDPTLLHLTRLSIRTGTRNWCQDTADALLRGLVRVASAQGPSDDDALLLVVHLLSGLVHLEAANLADLDEEIRTVIVAELCCQIRSYPWQRRQGSVAANLMLDTRRAVLTEFRGKPAARRSPRPVRVLACGGLNEFARAESANQQNAVEDGDIDVVDLLMWSIRRGVDAPGVALLIATEVARDTHGHDHREQAVEEVAARHGVTSRTLYRSRSRTLSALRAEVPTYLRDAA